MTFRKALSSVQVNGDNILQAAQQGYGQKKDDICVYFHPEHKKLVMEWFNNLFMKGTSLKHEREIETSVAKQKKEQQLCVTNIKNNNCVKLLQQKD